MDVPAVSPGRSELPLMPEHLINRLSVTFDHERIYEV
jgi:hypothetical protein